MRTGLILGSLLLLSTVSPAVAGQVFMSTPVDGWVVHCNGIWQNVPLQMTEKLALGGTLVLDSSGSYADAAMLAFDGGDVFSIVVEAHVYGPGRHVTPSALPAGARIHIPGTLHVGAVCAPGQSLSVYRTMYWCNVAWRNGARVCAGE